MFNRRQVTGLIPQSVRYGLRRMLFSGSHATCPLCENGIKSWASHGGAAEILERREVVGGMLRKDDRCPICHSADRTRLLMLYLDKIAEMGRKPYKVLHVAPDFGLYLWMQRQGQVDYVASDLDKSRYRHINNMVEANLCDLPFKDGEFDFLICLHVLEHVPDDLKAMQEMKRVLKPGGAALLLVPEAIDGGVPDENPAYTTPEDRHLHFGQWDHVRLYTRELFTERLEQAGLDVELFNAFESLPEEAKALRLNPLERLRVARNPVTS